MLRTTAFVVSTALLAVPALAQERWDGADDLDVNPLACTGEGGAEVVAKEYDGGQPTDAPDLAGQ
ncbi:MAG: substrate-binding domain-containing protein, partial [Geminicoccales bacterium]